MMEPVSAAAMHVRIWFDQGNRIVVSRYAGCVSVAGVRTDRDLIGNDLRFDPQVRRIIDARGVSEVNLSSRELQIMGSEAAHAAEAPRAFLVDSEATFALARVAAAWYERSRPNTRIFRHAVEAMAWFELPQDFLDGLPAPDHDVWIPAVEVS